MKRSVSVSAMLWRAFCTMMLLATLVGVSQATPFQNPLNTSHGGDPWLQYHEGYYYLASTTWSNEITMKKATTMAGLATAETVRIWDGSQDPATRCCNMWAFEFHLIDSENGPRWYFHYTAGVAENYDGQRMHVLESEGTDPMGPYHYKGQLEDSIGGWAIDGSYMTLNNNLYFLFSAWDGAYQKLYIAPMSNPWTISGNRVEISTPEYPWETQLNNVNEGAVALQHNGKTFVVYSASFCDGPEYKLGMLTYQGGDPLTKNAWYKNPEPVFQRADQHSVFGTGHNGFFKSPDGTEQWIVYHGQDSITGGCDNDRTTRVQKLDWNADGTPNFGIPLPTDAIIAAPSGEINSGNFTGVRIEAMNYPNYYLRHFDYRAKVEGDIRVFADSQWIQRPGLADANGVSFESVNFPGYFLRHQDFEVFVQEYDNSTLFNNDATFYVRQGLADPTLTSFEAYGLPGMYLRHQDLNLNITAATSDLAKKDATFRLHVGGTAPALIAGAEYYIKNRNSQKCLRTYNRSTTNAARVVQFTCTQSADEKWRLVQLGANEYQFVHVKSGKYADIFGASLSAGADNIIWPKNGGQNQKWRLNYQNNGYYHITNVNSNLRLDISGATKAENGSNIQWTGNNGDNQEWMFILADTP